jgi:hypothetical protein
MTSPQVQAPRAKPPICANHASPDRTGLRNESISRRFQEKYAPEKKRARRGRRCVGLLILTDNWEEECCQSDERERWEEECAAFVIINSQFI